MRMVAELAVETGISPRELVALEPEWLVTLIDVLEARAEAMRR